MGIKVKGVREAQEKLNAVVGDITGRKAVRAMTGALIIIGSEAAAITPIATSTLVNSQFRELSVSGTRITGRIGYSANYAVYVHEASGKLKGRPRPKKNGVAQGNYWDTGGEPQFLEKGAKRGKPSVDAFIKKEMQL